MGARLPGRPLLVRVSGLRRGQSANRPIDGSRRPAGRDGTGRRADGGRVAAGTTDHAAIAPVSDDRRHGRRGKRLSRLLRSIVVPNWFIRRRGLAMGLAFAGVGIGSVTLLPWVQLMIEQTGWRTACTAMGILILVVLAPINLLLRKRPEDIGLEPDGDAAPL